MPLYRFSEDDVEMLRLLAAERRRQGVLSRLPADGPGKAPDVFVCRAPPGGIPAPGYGDTGTGTGYGTWTGTGTLDEPGVADCDVYRVAFDQAAPRLEPVGLVQEVVNLGPEAVPGDSWIVVWRDRFGAWVTACCGGSGGGDGTQTDTSVTLPQWTADQHDYDVPDAVSTIYASTDASRTVTGLALEDDRTVTFVNAGTNPIVFAHESSSSATANRIWLPTGVGSSLTLLARDSATFTYDPGQGRARLVTTSAGSSLSQSIGDGINTTYTVTHGFGTTAVTVGVVRVSDGEIVYPTAKIPTADTVAITFASAPSTDQYYVVVQKGGPGTGLSGISDGAVLTTGLTFPLTGLKVRDTGGSHELTFAVGSVLTADRTFTVTTGDQSVNATFPATGTVALASGVDGGQTFTGGIASGNSLVLQGTSHATPGTVDLLAASSDTASVRDVGKVRHTTSGTAAAGFGAAQAFALEDASGNEDVAGRVGVVWTTPTHGAEASDVVYSSMRAGAMTEQARFTSSGAIRLAEVSAPATPAAGFGLLYLKSDGLFYSKDDAGTETSLGGDADPIGDGTNLTARTKWHLVATLTHADLTDADNSQDVLAYTLPAKASLHGAQLRTKTVGSGGGVATLTTAFRVNGVDVGAQGNGMSANDVAGRVMQVSDTQLGLYSWTATIDVEVRFTADPMTDVADLTGGEWEVYLLLSTLG